MTSPPAPHKTTRGAGAFFGNLFKLRKSGSWGDLREGSSRRGRRYDGEEYSAGRDSSTRSIMFDLELSQRGPRATAAAVAAAERLSRLQLDGSVDGGSAGIAPASPRTEATLQRVTYLARPVAPFEVDLLQDVQALRGAAEGPHGVLDLSRLAADLIAMGYACCLQHNDPTDPSQRTAAMAGMDRSCLEKLRHEFIVCTGRTDGSAHHYCLIDPRFRDQFALGQPTECYRAVLAALPVEFVGSPLRLQALANMLCLQIAEVYREIAMPLPPWRKPNAMLSRWFDVSSPSTAQQQSKPQQQQPAVAEPRRLEPAPAQLETRKSSGNMSTAPSEDGKGGSAQFFTMLALHQDSLRMQQQRRQQQQQQQQPQGQTVGQLQGQLSGSPRDMNSEKSNKPRRQQLMQQLEQQQALREQTMQTSSSPVSVGGRPGSAGEGPVVLSISRTRSGGWSDLATIVEAPSLHHPDAWRNGGGSSSASGSLAGSHSEHSGAAHGSPGLMTRPEVPVAQPVGGRAVSLLARSLKSMGQKDTWSSILPGRSFKGNNDTKEGSGSRRNASGRQTSSSGR